MEHLMTIRTDLAIEAQEMVTQRISHSVEGVAVETSRDEDVLITRVKVDGAAAERSLGKPAGDYVTIEAQGLKYNDPALHGKIMRLLAEELSAMLDLAEDATVLAVGLGNRNITADSLGPKALDKLVVTRHLKELLANDLRGGMRSVCAIEPGVLGITGIETAEIIQGITARVKPDAVIAVDALAAAASHRMNTTIQLANTGIHPGSGVDNKRFGLNKATLGVPVIAIGVPTVIHASTIAMDTIKTLREHAAFARYFRSLAELSEREQRIILRQVLPDTLGALMVTPKEVDQLTADLAAIIAGGVNQALHHNIDYENIHLYLQ